MGKQKKLFDQFPPVSTSEWMDRIRTDLKGADFNKKLVWKTREGFDVMPFYRDEEPDTAGSLSRLSSLFMKYRTSESGGGMEIQTTGKSWLIRQDIKVLNFHEANSKALSILMKGVDSLGFILPDPELTTEKNLKILLTDINAESAEINFVPNGKAREILSFMTGLAEMQGSDPAKIRGAIETDPLGRLMLNGTLCIPVEDGLDYLASLVKAAASLDNYRVLQINGSNLVNAGSDSVQELAYTLSMAVEYLSQLGDRGIAPEYAASKIRFCYATGSGYFMEIAKLRAARLLWSVIGNAFTQSDNDAFKMEIHCTTSEWNKTVYDPYINLLRTQTESMSAVLGGADSLIVTPFDNAYSQPGEFSERLARNQQLILKEEAYFDKVADPASGSYYIENLTALLAENAWKLFLEIEEKGGFLSELKAGEVQKQLSVSAMARRKNVARRKEILLGTNQYPNPDERLTEQLTGNIKYGITPLTDDLLVEPVTLFRGAEDFERLRSAVDRSNERPSVFLLTIGNLVLRKARAQFSAGFFGCAGYRIIESDGFENVDAGVEAAISSKAPVVVICGSDDEYPAVVPGIFNRLKDKTIVVVAGNPDNLEELRVSGVENFISIRSDVVETLSFYNSLLGI